ncbi:MAG: hypothetical protein K0R39_1052 [Symbiobacteriaceae bacterium]|jgi:hypothetical protein|nr:hypothetical protein [Symbiobacteriaceae bacterium]
MDCPVCPRVDIPADATVCPSCGVDLTPLRRATELGAAAYNEALRLAEAGASDAAMARAAVALTLDESLVPARVLLGKLLWNQGQCQAAQAQWQQAASRASEDAELRRLVDAAAVRLRRDRLARLVKPAGAALLALLLAAAIYLPYRAVLAGLDQLTAKVDAELAQSRAGAQDLSQQFAAYRSAHSHADAEYAEAVAQAAQRRQEAEAERTTAASLSKELQAYQAEHSHTNAAYEQAWAEVAALRKQVQELQHTLSAQR